jgi:hypothetical protein
MAAMKKLRCLKRIAATVAVRDCRYLACENKLVLAMIAIPKRVR